jgi:hypothetical protein
MTTKLSAAKEHAKHYLADDCCDELALPFTNVVDGSSSLFLNDIAVACESTNRRSWGTPAMAMAGAMNAPLFFYLESMGLLVESHDQVDGQVEKWQRWEVSSQIPPIELMLLALFLIAKRCLGLTGSSFQSP